MIEFFIAKRYLKAKHRMNFITIISLLSTIGITIGVAALVIVLSVFNGFGSLVTSILVNFDPHIKISMIDESAGDKLNDLTKILNATNGISSYYAFAEGKAILLNKKNYEIVNLKGLENQKDKSWGVASKIVSGSFDLDGNSFPKIILGLPLALRLSTRIGDTISVTSAYNIERTIASMAIPQSKKFIVTGIFESNNRDYDVSSVFTSLSHAQLLFGMKNNITGFELRLTNFNDAEKVKSELNIKINPKLFSINTWYDLHKELYNVMLIERWGAYILLCMIIAVAVFNIFASLTMTVMEKKRDIGVLRSMGVNQKSIRKIFMFEGILVGIIGIVFGLMIGTAVCYLQINYNFYPLDPTKYIIDALPVQVRLSDIFAIALAAMLLTFLASLYPAKRAVNTKIIDSIKYE
jgi:lipoprotein-releasing system permease protein